MAMNGAYKKLIHYCPNRLLAIKQLGKKMNVIYSLKGINRVKILQSVNDLLLQIDDWSRLDQTNLKILYIIISLSSILGIFWKHSAVC